MQPGRERPPERRRGDQPGQGWGSLTSWLLSNHNSLAAISAATFRLESGTFHLRKILSP